MIVHRKGAKDAKVFSIKNTHVFLCAFAVNHFYSGAS